jgi:hypothetical protein
VFLLFFSARMGLKRLFIIYFDLTPSSLMAMNFLVIFVALRSSHAPFHPFEVLMFICLHVSPCLS